MIIDIIKSDKHAGNGRGLGRYLLNREQAEQNAGEQLGAYITDARHQGEKLEWAAAANVGTPDPRLAVEMIAAHNSLNHRSRDKSVHIVASLPEGDRLTPEQWREVEKAAVKALGMEHHPRLVAVHRNTAHQHMHLWVSRIHPETHNAVYMRGDFYKLQRVATDFERRFGLKIEPHTLNLAQTLEHRQGAAQELRTSDLGREIVDSFRQSDNGHAFKASLAAKGLELALGNRRDCFVVIDAGGEHQAVNKKLTGHTVEEIKSRFSDIERAQLPTVAQAKEMQNSRRVEREAARKEQVAAPDLDARRSGLDERAAKRAQERREAARVAEAPAMSPTASGGRRRAQEATSEDDAAIRAIDAWRSGVE
ncbi:MAG: relaxase/mobilization nuclease domain-containing protein, partial [Acetobacteraceae bacterium]